ncbi:ATP-dependent RNA helicase dbp10 [Ceratobasidium sp. 423]|nr:ATP-dependent RNA helicase dbp10 [Ceratobasidium sp. 423]
MAKRREESVSESSDAELSESESSDDQIDIFNALANPGAGKGKNKQAEESDLEEDDTQFIQRAIEKRNKKGGTEVMKAVNSKGKLAKGAVGGGSFQSMGLNPSLLRSLLLRGFKTPTPIQRQSIPVLLSTPPRDLVGMARTGSGKTLAYMVPLVQRLGGRHATAFGARALVLVPARELALQVLKVGKDLVRGWHSDGGAHAGDRDVDEPIAETSTGKGSGQNLRWGLVVGGEGMDEQFEMISSNPDVIIATPGRLLHLVVEMNLDLRSVQYVVFDEADRLFELGFATALQEILHRLPPTRQTVLFSATLPKNLVEFAKAGLQDPKLVRLDSESKISSDLRMAFFSVKQEEKEAALLALLRDIIKVPLGEPVDDSQPEEPSDKKSKSKNKIRPDVPAEPHQTLIFTATKHHVEHISTLLTAAGYSVAHIYGSLDQAARTLQMNRFRMGRARILVVTDVAARGIDIPVLENVVNYDFPMGARVFVHRVGRTARAGRKGWAWSFVSHSDLPYLLDLQLFLGRPLVSRLKGEARNEAAYTTNLVLGTFPRNYIDESIESIRLLDQSDASLTSLRSVMQRGQGLYMRTQGKASTASYARAKTMVKDTTGTWSLAGGESEGAAVHPVFELAGNDKPGQNNTADKENNDTAVEAARMAMLKVVNGFRPAETVFEIGTRGKKVAGATLMKDRRKALEKAQKRVGTTSAAAEDSDGAPDEDGEVGGVELEMADEDDIETAFGGSKKRKRNHKDEEYCMSHYQKDAYTEKGYSLRDGATFAEQARNATFDLTTDEALTGRQRHDKQLNWDAKKKKFVKGSGEGADNVKIVKTESGARLPATYRSGRFEEWKAKTKTSLPKIGEAESERRFASGAKGGRMAGKKFVHQGKTDAKPLDPLALGYERKSRQMKKRQEKEKAFEADDDPSGGRGGKGGKHGKGGKNAKNATGRRYGGKSMGHVKNELKSADQIRKSREAMAKKKAKNARPSKKGKGWR